GRSDSDWVDVCPQRVAGNWGGAGAVCAAVVRREPRAALAHGGVEWPWAAQSERSTDRVLVGAAWLRLAGCAAAHLAGSLDADRPAPAPGERCRRIGKRVLARLSSAVCLCPGARCHRGPRP